MMNDKLPSIKMDPNNLWREEVISDRQVGMIRKLTPIKADNTADLSRKVIFMGETALMTAAGSLPLNFEIPASDLQSAVAGFGDAMQKAFTEAMKEIQEMRRRAASQIVIPKGGASELVGSGLPPVPGKIHLS